MLRKVNLALPARDGASCCWSPPHRSRGQRGPIADGDLRHAAVSTWLNAGVPATQVAAWAGHSVAVLLQIYAKCLVGQEDAARRRIDAVLGES